MSLHSLFRRTWSAEDKDPMHFNQDEEDIDSFVEDIKNETNWIIHRPSARDDNTLCELKTVVLRPDQPGVQGDDEPALGFRATISLLVNHEFHVDLPLRTSPVFIGPPRCYPSDPAGHAMHARQVEYYQVEVGWLIG
jgi:hypothetical protein